MLNFIEKYQDMLQATQNKIDELNKKIHADQLNLENNKKKLIIYRGVIDYYKSISNQSNERNG